MKTGINEEKLIKQLTPKIERIVYRTVKDILPFEEIYPPESRLRKGFIQNIKRARKKKGVVFKNKKELEKYLKGLKR